jgi:hypothetical protein
MAIGTGGTAAQLAATSVVDTQVPIVGPSAARELMNRGLKVEFGQSAAIAIPGRLCDDTNSSSFVQENNPIPIKVGTLTSVTLTPCRLPVTAVFSDWLVQTSNADRIIPAVLNEELRLKLDVELMSTTAASAGVRPAGLLNGVTPLTPTAAGSEAMEKDIAQLVAAINTAGGGSDICFVCSPAQAATLKLRASPKFDYPILSSGALANGSIAAIDAASLVSALNPLPDYETSNATAVHMEDTNPAQLTTGTGPTVATPIRSMYQTACTAVRLIWTVSWAMRASSMVQVINSCNW